ncbi:MAG: GNAT family N-acetyltransferase [Christensenella sp.]|nr:GNAT family N-acetyltransferase [Christensenella sp.]
MRVELIEAYQHILDVSALFEEYAASIDVDLNYQNFSGELSGLPGKYAKPDGGLYLALVDDFPAGCAAMRRLDSTRAEMKRLFVRPDYRNLHLGRMLAERIIQDAAAAEYRFLVLDTLSTMDRAKSLYRALGFVEIAPYYSSPVAETTFLSLSLDPCRMIRASGANGA